MKFQTKLKTGLKDIGKNDLIKDERILEILEDVAGEHSNQVGYGALDIKNTKLAWILLDWKVKVIKRPMYTEELTIITWGRNFQKIYTYRDYEIYNDKGELCIIATSKWALLNVETRSVAKMSDEIVNVYKPEEKSVFEEEKIERIETPTDYSKSYKYKVSRRDIDIVNHMHNTFYLDIAYETLPEEVYKTAPFDNIRINYKHEINLGDNIECKYAFNNEKHYVVFEKDERICSTIELY